METLFQAGDVASFVTMAGIVATLPALRHRGRLKAAGENNRRSRDEKELGPPSFEDFMALWQGLRQVRANEFYGLSDRRNIVTDRDVYNRVSALCRRANWGVALEKKLIMLALRREERDAERFFPGRGLFFFAKSRILQVECHKVLKHFKKTGLIQYGQPVFEHAEHKHMLARALAERVGKPNDAIVGTDQKVVYEFFSLDVHQVLSEQGRYYLMKGCAEISTDSKLGLANVKVFQRWGQSPKQRGLDDDSSGSFQEMEEEYTGNIFMQDDIVYVVAFKTDHTSQGAPVEHDPAKSRKNMITLVLSGFSREGDGFHNKMTGGQLGHGIGGTVGVLSAPCVFYRVRQDRMNELQDAMKRRSPQMWTRISEGRSKESINYEILKWDSEFLTLLDGVDRKYAPIMADLDVPMPVPSNEEEGGPEIVIGGR